MCGCVSEWWRDYKAVTTVCFFAGAAKLVLHSVLDILCTIPL